MKKEDVYSSIEDMPIYNWLKIHETNDLSFLLQKRRKIDEKNKLFLEICLSELRDEFIDYFGVSDQLRQILDCQGKIAQLRYDAYVLKDRSALTFLAIEEANLKTLTTVNKDYALILTSQKVAISKMIGGMINTKEISVKEYYEYLKYISAQHDD